jgi:hypothetical protein
MPGHDGPGSSRPFTHGKASAVVAPTPQFESEPEASAYNFTWQLAHNRYVDPTTDNAAARCVDNKAFVDMVMLIGLSRCSRSKEAA